MEYTIDAMNDKEIRYIENLFITCKRRFYKLLYFIFILEFFLLFTPISILVFFKRGAKRSQFDSEFLFSEIGTLNVFLFILLPTVIFLLVLYFVILKIHGLKKDLRKKEKLTSTVEILEIRPIPKNSSESFEGLYDYKTVFKISDLDVDDISFNSKQNPECLDAKAYKIEISRFAKVHLLREMVK